jgi:hypothetical protein
MVTRLHLQADQSGSYRGMSAQFSGEGFADMHFNVEAVAPEKFSEWVDTTRSVGAELNVTTYAELAKPFYRLHEQAWERRHPEQVKERRERKAVEQAKARAEWLAEVLRPGSLAGRRERVAGIGDTIGSAQITSMDLPIESSAGVLHSRFNFNDNLERGIINFFPIGLDPDPVVDSLANYYLGGAPDDNFFVLALTGDTHRTTYNNGFSFFAQDGTAMSLNLN